VSSFHEVPSALPITQVVIDIAIAGHSGTVDAMFRVIGHKPYAVPPGGALVYSLSRIGAYFDSSYHSCGYKTIRLIVAQTPETKRVSAYDCATFGTENENVRCVVRY
jgi:hypothetical protein